MDSMKIKQKSKPIFLIIFSFDRTTAKFDPLIAAS
jgi:hypothetical protein